MTTATQKLQILESLNALDQSQTEKVLAYIKNMLVTSRDEMQYKRFKREAMKEIRQALKTDRSLKSRAWRQPGFVFAGILPVPGRLFFTSFESYLSPSF